MKHNIKRIGAPSRRNGMHSFYTEEWQGDLAVMNKEDAHHASRVLRIKTDEEIVIVSGGKRWLCAYRQDGLATRIKELASTEPKVRITLYQGIAKGDRMEQAVQKCIEIGVQDFYPCLMERCVAQEAKGERWNRIAREAAKQSGRTVLPTVHEALSFKALCAKLKTHELALVAWEEEKESSLPQIYRGEKDVAIVIGPEGGMTPQEVSALPAKRITLGPRILRTETAGLVMAAGILFLSGDMA